MHGLGHKVFYGDWQYAQLFNNKKHAPVPARSVASLRSSPLSVGLRCVASRRRSGLQFLFVLYRWLRGYAAPPPAIVFRPLRGSNLGSLSLAI